MKIHYNKDFECYMVADCHKTNIIELDGVQLIPITELEEITNEILNLEDEETDLDDEYEFGKYQGYKCCELLIGNHIVRLKGENK